MNKNLKIIIGILFYPYGLYLIYLWYKENKKLKEINHSVRTESTSTVKEEQIVNKPSSEKLKDKEQVVEEVRTESSSTVQEELLEKKKMLELEKKQKEENEIKWKKQRIERENREKIERENKELSEKEKTQTEKKKQKSKEKYLKFIKELDEDGNGIIDVVQSDDFSNILKKNQEKIIEINREYIKQFVQVSSFLNTKRKSLQSVFENLLKTVNEGGTYTSLYETIDFNSYSNNLVTLVKEVKKITGLGLTESKQIVEDYFRGEGELNKKNKYFKSIDEESVNRYFEILKEDIHLFNILLLFSLNMVESLVKNDMISFYEIYEKFDQMNMFDSKHEKDIKEQLKNINNNIENVMSEIKIMGKQIISSLGDLNSSLDELIYSTQESNERIVEGLESVNSSIDVNNLISSIQTYQLYKINKNTRGLRE
jgi:hypothetical protein